MRMAIVALIALSSHLDLGVRVFLKLFNRKKKVFMNDPLPIHIKPLLLAFA
jgi:hypothetical protein